MWVRSTQYLFIGYQQPRKVGFITIPSLMGLVLGKDIPGKKFVWFVLLNVLLIVVLSIIL